MHGKLADGPLRQTNRTRAEARVNEMWHSRRASN